VFTCSAPLKFLKMHLGVPFAPVPSTQLASPISAERFALLVAFMVRTA
jgi:hypothetical protein